ADISVHCSESCGTVEDTIEESTSLKDRPRSASRLDSAAPSSSPVDSRTVAKRQCSATTSEESANTPKWVWVLPTSTTSSMAGHYRGLEEGIPCAHHLLARTESRERVRQPPVPGQRQIRIE